MGKVYLTLSETKLNEAKAAAKPVSLPTFNFTEESFEINFENQLKKELGNKRYYPMVFEPEF